MLIFVPRQFQNTEFATLILIDDRFVFFIDNHGMKKQVKFRMGNIENCHFAKVPSQDQELISEDPIIKPSQYTKQKTHELKKYAKEILPKKAEFFYVKPILLQKTILVDIQNSEVDDNKKSKVKTSKTIKTIKTTKTIDGKQNEEDEESDIIEKTFNKISVQWNSFAKIKKKSYLQDYIFMKQIGKGAYGSVCKIKMKYGGLLRAAKIIKTSAIFKEKNSGEKFFAEIALPMELDHPNLIKLYEVFEWKKQFVLVMELCEGGDLFHRIKENKIFSEKKASQIMKQILSAVFYMHKKSVAHRDLKPENMLYDIESKLLKIIDFGTATKFKTDEKMKSLVGTPYYLAPEVIKGEYDCKCDVWSCGVILFIMLCGYPPFNGKNERDIMDKIAVQPVEFSSQIWSRRSTSVKQLISKMLCKKPQDRISAEQALNSDWITNAPSESQGSGSSEAEAVGGQICKNLKSFCFQNKLKAVVYTYIASQLYSNKDKQKLLKAFREMDKDGDGVIGKEELVQVFNEHSGSTLGMSEVQKILELVDTNGSGLIDFTEFLVAASNEEKILERQRLENAFNYLDTDHSGYISIDEVKAFLDGSDETSEDIKKIFDEVDDNGDGNISKKQFLSLLLKKQ